MLEIKPKLKFKIPDSFLASSPAMKFASVVDDEGLTEAITEDADIHDDNWRLTEHPDTDELERYWTKIQQDVKNDPEWFVFTDDSA